MDWAGERRDGVGLPVLPSHMFRSTSVIVAQNPSIILQDNETPGEVQALQDNETEGKLHVDHDFADANLPKDAKGAAHGDLMEVSGVAEQVVDDALSCTSQAILQGLLSFVFVGAE